MVKKIIITVMMFMFMLLSSIGVIGALNDSLHLCYEFDTNGTVPDFVGDNNGTITGAIFTVDGKINGTYEYNGSTQYIESINDLNISGNDIYSVSFWGFENEYALNDLFMSVGQGGGTNQLLGIHTGSDDDEEILLNYWGANNVDVDISPSNYTDDWVHIAYTYNGTAEKLYADGVLKHTRTISHSGILDYKMDVGGHTGGFDGHYLDGKVDELVVWKGRAITQSEVNQLYNADNGLQCTSFNETVNENSSLSFDGIEIDTFSFTSPTYTLVEQINFNTTENLTMIFPISFSTEKTTGSLQNIISMRIDVDNVTLYDKVVRTVSKTLNIGSTGALIVNNISDGEHVMDIYFKRTGNGEIEVTNYNVNFGSPLNSDDNELPYEGTQNQLNNLSLIANVSQSFHNLSLNMSNAGQVFVLNDLKLSNGESDDIRIYVNNTDTNEISTIMIRSLESGTVGAMSVNSIMSNNSIGINNYSMMIVSLNTTDVSIDSSCGFLGMVDDDGNTVQGYNISDDSNLSQLHNHSAGTELVLSDVFTWFEGDGVFYTYTSSSISSGTSEIEYQINVSDINETICTDVTTRSYNTTIGNQYLHGFCGGLSIDTEYNISIYATYSGDILTHYEDVLTYIESDTLGVSQVIDTIPPTVNITIPLNTSQYFDGNMSGTCTDDFAIQSVTINDSRFIFNIDSSSADWNFVFNETGEYSFGINISCTDISGNVGTAVYDVLIDTVDPSITINSPIDDERYNESVYLDISYYDERLFNATTIVYYPNGSIFYIDNVEDINTTVYNVTINFTSINFTQYGFYNVSAKACDSHTSTDIDFTKWDKSKDDTDKSIRFNNVKIRVLGDIEDIEDYSYNCKDDRCIWEYRIKESKSSYTEVVTCDMPFKTVSNTDYKGHLICGGQWVDAETENNLPVVMVKIDDYTYQYQYDIKGLKDGVISSKSVGELNCNQKEIQFEYINGSLTESTAYTPPQIFQGSLIGNIPETVPEALMLFFILALCIVVTAFAASDKARGWWFFASITWIIFGLVIMPYSFAFGFIFLVGSFGLMFSKLF